MSGYYGDLSPEQEEALTKFKEAISDVWKDSYDDYVCLRWLRARSFNVAKALEMFRNHLEFREKWKADTILEDYKPPEVIKKFYPHGEFGFDREGHPVFYQPTGNADFRGLHKSIKQEDLQRHIVYLNEKASKRLRDLSKEKGKVIETNTIIMDLENLSYKRHYYWPGIKGFQAAVKLLEDNYPERVKQSLIVKAPKLFPVAYNLIKPFLDERTRQKVKVLGSNWKEELQKYIDADNLPEAYGGNRREPDAECSDHICPGGDIPMEYYLTNMTETSQDDMQMVQVGRGSTIQLEYIVEAVGSAIRWEFVTVDYDIGFGVYYKEKEEKKRVHKGHMMELITSERRNSHLAPESGILICERIGIYVLRFDNKYSWARTKEVKYSVSVHEPDTDLVEHHQFMGIHKKDRVAAGGQDDTKNDSEEEEFIDAVDETSSSRDLQLDHKVSVSESFEPEKTSLQEDHSIENGSVKPLSTENGSVKPLSTENGSVKPLSTENGSVKPLSTENRSVKPLSTENGSVKPLSTENGSVKPLSTENGSVNPPQETKGSESTTV